MGKRWLGGVVLGLSLALLATAGCADKDCIECYPWEVNLGALPDEIPDKYVVNLSAQLTDHQLYCANLYQNGVPVREEPECGQPEAGLATASFFVTCDDPTFFVSTNIRGVGPFDGEVANPFGQWELRAWVEGVNSQNFDDWDWLVEWLVADVCEPEFVPEPGTIALLGSGLAGLAGYATLRWRRRR